MLATSNIVEHSPCIHLCCKCKLQLLPALLKDLLRYQITHFQRKTFSLLRKNHFQFLYAKMHNLLLCYKIHMCMCVLVCECMGVCVWVCVCSIDRHTMQSLISSTNSLVTRYSHFIFSIDSLLFSFGI